MSKANHLQIQKLVVLSQLVMMRRKTEQGFAKQIKGADSSSNIIY
jgi:hypothetical protein